MKHYEAAEALAGDGNDDAVLRWNSCARIIERDRLHAERRGREHRPRRRGAATLTRSFGSRLLGAMLLS